ncbi:hypothetical protein HRI96_01485 [Treponema parvum]|uniref:Uncharacterized protein n=1 Tax=Treponema parvum TaxID=138851 RepID=A0A975EY67_9SPIR|nr:hypothetical protein [Treponema parvum]QTQ10982.1 hypothetical protein HRI96_01485 [Treponema parvum]QTQ17070.1 hypothetical protein HXT04_10425 [Treponema parvum]
MPSDFRAWLSSELYQSDAHRVCAVAAADPLKGIGAGVCGYFSGDKPMFTY